MGSNEDALPAEVLTTPAALVGLTGLDVKIQEHKRIWDLLTVNRGLDRHPIHFVNIPYSDRLDFPAAKPTRNSYEWYIPKGLLKKNWMTKHLYQLPAVVAIFVQLDWNNPKLSDRIIDCANRLQAVRLSLAGRMTKLALVLIQSESTPTESSAEDVNASEAVTSLCTECEISSRALFTLPSNDDLPLTVMRLENSLHEMAQNYYHLEIKNIRGHREMINKSTHLYLFVRHQYKLGFLNELKSDFHAAYKAYQSGYGLLMEVRSNDTNIMEIKTIAGFINYKICRLAFRLNLPRDAISQFRKHLDIFRTRIGQPELGWEHAGWQASQCAVFGNMFQDAVRGGLPAIQTQHPGIYYQLAAEYAISRRKLAEELCSQVSSYPAPDPLQHAGSIEFYGQRPWRPGKVSLDPPDLQKEKEGIEALQYRERTKTKHSQIIMELQSLAIKQFEAFKSPRMKTQLTVQMAEEMMAGHDYPRALETLVSCLGQYRGSRGHGECWPRLLATLLQKALRCAYLTANIAEYAQLCLELAGPESQAEKEERERVWTNLSLLTEGEGKSPWPEPNLTGKSERASVGLAAQHWAKAVKDGGIFQVDIKQFRSCIGIEVVLESEVKVGDKLTMEVIVTNHGFSDIWIRRLEVCLGEESPYNQHCVSETSEVVCAGHKENFTFQFLPESQDVGKYVKVENVKVTCGTGHLSLVLNKRFDVEEKKEVESTPFQRKCMVINSKVVPRESKMDLSFDYQAPMLVGEWLRLMVELCSGESGCSADLEVGAWLRDGGDPLISDTTSLTIDYSEPEPCTPLTPEGSKDFSATPIPIHQKLGNLESGENTKTCFYVRASTTGIRAIIFEVKYSVVVGGVSCACSKTSLVELEVVEPFSMECKLLTLRLEEAQVANTDEPFLIVPHIRYSGQHTLTILDSKLEPRVPVVAQSATASLAGTILRQDTTVSQAVPLTIPQKSLLSQLDNQTVALGRYSLEWRRDDSSSSPTCSTTFDLPSIKVIRSPLFASCRLPAYGTLRSPLQADYTFYNRTEELQDFVLTTEPSEAFMFSGTKQLHFKIFPLSSYRVHFVYYPLLSGRVPLPRLRLAATAIDKTTNVDETLDRLLPSHIMVIPKKKTGGKPKTETKTEQFVLTEPVVIKNEAFPVIHSRNKVAVQTWMDKAPPAPVEAN